MSKYYIGRYTTKGSKYRVLEEDAPELNYQSFKVEPIRFNNRKVAETIVKLTNKKQGL